MSTTGTSSPATIQVRDGCADPFGVTLLVTRMTSDTIPGTGDQVRELDERVVRAIDLVVDGCGGLDVWFATGLACLEGSPDALRRLALRAGSPALAAAVPADGRLARLDYDSSIAVVQALARRNRLQMEHHLLAEERRVSRGGLASGGPAGFADACGLVRRWMAGRPR